MPIADPIAVGRCRRRTRFAYRSPIASFGVQNPAPALRQLPHCSPVCDVSGACEQPATAPAQRGHMMTSP